jgi:hypothetical protein
MKKAEVMAAYKSDPNTEFAIVKPGAYYSRQAINQVIEIPLVRVVKVKLLSDQPFDPGVSVKGTLYEYQTGQKIYPKAKAGEKRPGVLIHNEALDEVFVVESSVFIGIHSAVEQLHADRATIQAKQQAEQNERERVERLARSNAHERTENATQQLRLVFEGLLNRKLEHNELAISLRTDVEWRAGLPVAKIGGNISFDYKTILLVTNKLQDLAERTN